VKKNGGNYGEFLQNRMFRREGSELAALTCGRRLGGGGETNGPRGENASGVKRERGKGGTDNSRPDR